MMQKYPNTVRVDQVSGHANAKYGSVWERPRCGVFVPPAHVANVDANDDQQASIVTQMDNNLPRQLPYPICGALQD